MSNNKPAEVHIRRRPVNNHLPTVIQNSSVYRIGSVYKQKGPLRGISPEQERKYLPQIIHVQPGSPEWTKATSDFWAELTVPVGMEGLVLNISLDENDEPLNLNDWLVYQWCMKHPKVANDEREMLKTPSKDFYIFDPVKEDRRLANETEKRLNAYTALISNKRKKNWSKLRRAYQVITKSNPYSITNAQLITKLENYAKLEPDTLVSVLNDKHLDTKGFIYDCLENNILSQAGNAILFEDDVIGRDMEETIIYIGDRLNSGSVVRMKSLLKEKKKFDLLNPESEEEGEETDIGLLDSSGDS